MSRAFAILITAGLTFIPAANASAATILSENFDNVANLVPNGWVIVNNSSPAGTTDWFQGNAAIFAAQSGAPNAYVAANFFAADFGGNISNWLLSPALTFDNGHVVRFWTRTEVGSIGPDRLELRLSVNGSSTNVGGTDASVGDFTTLLMTINPALSPGGYPENWTLLSATISGLGGPTSGRLAFRYNVTDTTVNGNYIGIDSVTVNSPSVPEPVASGLLAIGILAAARARRSVTRRSR